MQQERKKLSVRVAPGTDQPVAGPADIVGLAVSRKLCVAAVYNKMAVTLAPHIVYTRHDELYVDGVVLEREGKPPREIKLGTFKLAGLAMLALTGRVFTPQSVFDANDAKYAGTTVSVIRV